MTDDTMTMTEDLSNDSEGEGEPIGAESVEDSARAVLEELGGSVETDDDIQGSEGAAGEKPAINASEAASILARSKRKGKGEQVAEKVGRREVKLAQPNPKPEAAAGQPEEVELPQRLSPDDRLWLKKQPVEAQKMYVRAINNLEGAYTKKHQDLARVQSRYEHLDRNLEPYVHEWAEQGLTKEAAILQLAAANRAIRQDPVAALDRLMQQTGVTPEHVHARRTGAAPQQHAQQSVQPSQGLTVADLDRILQEREQQTQQAADVQSATTDYERVRVELGPNGSYLYPELWDANNPQQAYWNAAFLQRVQPLVIEARKTHPGISWGEALKRAVNTLRVLGGQQPAPMTSGSPSPVTPRLTSEQQATNVRNASVSVRSRGNGVIPSTAVATQRESYEDSARAVLAMFTNNSH